MFILDTDHISLLERPNSAEAFRIRARLETTRNGQVWTTIISFEEQMRGWLSRLAQARSVFEQVQAYKRLGRMLDNYKLISALPFDDKAAAQLEHLRRQRIRVGTMDLKIAAIVIVHDATLVTRNLRDFAQVPGLKVGDWTKP